MRLSLFAIGEPCKVDPERLISRYSTGMVAIKLCPQPSHWDSFLFKPTGSMSATSDGRRRYSSELGSATTTSTTISPSVSESVHFGIPPAAVRFLLTSAILVVFFGLIFFTCCVSYRLRRARMRAMVVSAFEEVCADPHYIIRLVTESWSQGLIRTRICPTKGYSAPPGSPYYCVYSASHSEIVQAKPVSSISP